VDAGEISRHQSSRGHQHKVKSLDVIARLFESEVRDDWLDAMHQCPLNCGNRFGVHNGKEYIPIEVQESMIGHKLGERTS
jgi:small subunit ribosomal protein S19